MAFQFNYEGVDLLYDDDVWVRLCDSRSITKEQLRKVASFSNILWYVEVYHYYHNFRMDINTEGLLDLYQSDCPLVTHEMRQEAKNVLTGNIEPRNVQFRVTPPKKLTGHIYVFRNDKYYKIGRTNDVERRLKQLSHNLPTPLEVICTIPSDDLIKDEQELHSRFDDKRTKGEWFKLSQEDVTWLKTLSETCEQETISTSTIS